MSFRTVNIFVYVDISVYSNFIIHPHADYQSAKLSNQAKSSRPKILLSACVQRGGGFTQAGVSVRLGREQMMLLPALCQTSLHPRLRETAR